MSKDLSYRINTNVGKNEDSFNIDFQMNQTYDMFEILSLKLTQKSLYSLSSSNTGVIVGRVLAGSKDFGIPNAKVSVFIPYENIDDIKKYILYHYESSTDTDNGIRYNLLPEDIDEICHQDVGTFYNKEFLLDNKDLIEIFDKYYKYTTTTNNAGDYMIYGVPTGAQTLHVDIDLSDIGILSQRPRDMVNKGYNINQFESPNKFKKSKNLNQLVQIYTQDKGLEVFPFWGDTTDDETNASITRCDIKIDYEFEPTCVFIGSIVTDGNGNAISKKCVADEDSGKMSDLITGEGMIEMIRKTPDGKVQEFNIKGGRLIDSDGTWCYQIPMNLDYVRTDEYGNMIPTDNPDSGIPTRARVRFRISIDEIIDTDSASKKRARFLVPNNPRYDAKRYPEFTKSSQPDADYEFGSFTKDENFCDLFMNKVYTVKSYIPRIQKSVSPNRLHYTGIKAINHYGANNPMPYNNLQIRFKITFRILCVLSELFAGVIRFINTMYSRIFGFFLNMATWKVFTYKMRNKILKLATNFQCISVTGLCDDGNEYFPGCQNRKNDPKKGALAYLKLETGNYLYGVKEEEDDNDDDDEKKNKVKHQKPPEDLVSKNPITTLEPLFNCIESGLSEDNEIIKFNFQNDWINGVLYAPMWYRHVKSKRKYFFNLIKLKAKDQWCSADKRVRGYRGIKLYHTCALPREFEENILYKTIKKGITEDDKIKFTSHGYIVLTEMPNVNSKDAKEKILVKDSNSDTYTAYIKSKEKYIKQLDKNSNQVIMNYFNIFNQEFKNVERDKQNANNGYGFKCHKRSLGILKIENGIIKSKETKYGQTVFYYKAIEYNNSNLLSRKYDNSGNVIFENKPKDYVKLLFATDIVLLGSLNENDIDGTPQFFKNLPSTTYNMPNTLLTEEIVDKEIETRATEIGGELSIGGIEFINSNKEKIITSFSNLGNVGTNLYFSDRSENVGEGYDDKYTDTTGADWGNHGLDQNFGEYYRKYLNENRNGNQYKIDTEILDDGGLFYGINCNFSFVKPKSCENLKRICEYGVQLDSSIEVPDLEKINELRNDPNLNTKNINYNEIYKLLIPDGYISYDEIYDHDGRSMFATMNGNYLKTRVNPMTGFKVYDFEHSYIQNFDGSMQGIMKYRNGGGGVRVKENWGYNYIQDYNPPYADNWGVLPNGKYPTYFYNDVMEELDYNYMKFRYGEELYFYLPSDSYNMVFGGTKKETSDKSSNTNDYITFPRYENSFYFYFGLKAGSTAIDKFRTQFYSECTSDETEKPTFDVDIEPNSWCSNGIVNLDEKLSNDGYVRIKTRGLSKPYTLKIVPLSNSSTEECFKKDINFDNIFIGDKDNISSESISKLYTYNNIILDTKNKKDAIKSLNNGSYLFTFIDSNGIEFDNEVEIEQEYLSYKYSVKDFTETNETLISVYENNQNIANQNDISNLNMLDRKIGGYIVINDIMNNGELMGGDGEQYQIIVKPSNPNDITKELGEWDGVCVVPFEISKNLYESGIYNKDLVPFVNTGNTISSVNGLLKKDKSGCVIGVPKGDIYYDIIITQICPNGECSCDDRSDYGFWEDGYTQNSVKYTVLVQCPKPIRLLINDVDYNFISLFETGWYASNRKIFNITNGNITFNNTIDSFYSGSLEKNIPSWLNMENILNPIIKYDNKTIKLEKNNRIYCPNIVYNYTEIEPFIKGLRKENTLQETNDIDSFSAFSLPYFVKEKRKNIKGDISIKYYVKKDPSDITIYISRYEELKDEKDLEKLCYYKWPINYCYHREMDETIWNNLSENQKKEEIDKVNSLIQKRLDVSRKVRAAFSRTNNNGKDITLKLENQESFDNKFLISYVADTLIDDKPSFVNSDAKYKFLEESTLNSTYMPTIIKNSNNKYEYNKIGNLYKKPYYVGCITNETSFPISFTDKDFETKNMSNLFGVHIIDKLFTTNFRNWVFSEKLQNSIFKTFDVVEDYSIVGFKKGFDSTNSTILNNKTNIDEFEYDNIKKFASFEDANNYISIMEDDKYHILFTIKPEGRGLEYYRINEKNQIEEIDREEINDYDFIPPAKRCANEQGITDYVTKLDNRKYKILYFINSIFYYYYYSAEDEKYYFGKLSDKVTHKQIIINLVYSEDNMYKFIPNPFINDFSLEYSDENALYQNISRLNSTTLYSIGINETEYYKKENNELRKYISTKPQFLWLIPNKIWVYIKQGKVEVNGKPMSFLMGKVNNGIESNVEQHFYSEVLLEKNIDLISYENSNCGATSLKFEKVDNSEYNRNLAYSPYYKEVKNSFGLLSNINVSKREIPFGTPIDSVDTLASFSLPSLGMNISSIKYKKLMFPLMENYTFDTNKNYGVNALPIEYKPQKLEISDITGSKESYNVYGNLELSIADGSYDNFEDIVFDGEMDNLKIIYPSFITSNDNIFYGVPADKKPTFIKSEGNRLPGIGLLNKPKFTIKNTSNKRNIIRVCKSDLNAPNINLEYSISGNSWVIPNNIYNETIILESGESVAFKGENLSFTNKIVKDGETIVYRNYFMASENFKVGGDLMSLLTSNPDNFWVSDEDKEYVFYGLFKYDTLLSLSVNVTDEQPTFYVCHDLEKYILDDVIQPNGDYSYLNAESYENYGIFKLEEDFDNNIKFKKAENLNNIPITNETQEAFIVAKCGVSYTLTPILDFGFYLFDFSLETSLMYPTNKKGIKYHLSRNTVKFFDSKCKISITYKYMLEALGGGFIEYEDNVIDDIDFSRIENINVNPDPFGLPIEEEFYVSTINFDNEPNSIVSAVLIDPYGLKHKCKLQEKKKK